MIKNNPKKQAWILAAGLLAGSLFVLPQVFASMTMDQTLDYLVGELQQRITSLSQNNKQLQQKVDALRNRILFLRQEMRNLDNRKIDLVEQANQYRDSLKLENRKDVLADEKKAFWETRKGNLKKEQQGILEALDRARERYSHLQAKSGEEKKALEEEARKKQSAIVAADQLAEQKIKLRKQISVLQSEQMDLQSQIQATTKLLQGRAPEKTVLEEIRSSLKKNLANERKALDAAVLEENTVQSTRDSLVSGQRKALEAQTQEITQLRQQMAQLEQTIADFKNVKASVIKACLQQNQLLAQMKNVFLEQRGLLKQEEGLLAQAQSMILKNRSDLERKKQAEAQQIFDLKQRLNILNQQAQDILAQLAQQKEKGVSFSQEEKALQQELQELRAQKTSPRTQISEEFLKRQTQLTQSLQAEAQKKAELKARIDLLKKELSKMEGQSKDLVEGRLALQSLRDAAREAVRKNEDAARELAGQSGILEGRRGQAAIEAQSEINNLLERKDLLSKSLSIIRPRYDAQLSAVKNFQKEAVQLKDYQQSLIVENKGLKDKERELQAALQSFKKSAR